jgi:hypothetical protein
LENAQLYQATRDRLLETQSLHQVTLALLQKLELEEVLQMSAPKPSTSLAQKEAQLVWWKGRMAAYHVFHGRIDGKNWPGASGTGTARWL